MKFYIDEEYRCHMADDGAMREVEDSCFDGKCDEYIEGFCYIPGGESGLIDGMEYAGRMLCALGDYAKMELAQARFELEQAVSALTDADAALKELGVLVDG